MVVFVPDAPGPLRHAERFTRGVAGAESNVAIGLCRLGHRAGWSGRVGDDEFGAFILATLRGEGVDVRLAVRDARGPTGVMFKERSAGADSRVFYYRRHSAASLLDAADVPAAELRRAKWLHLTGITPALGEGPRRAVFAAAEGARAAGVRVSFDPNYRARLWSPEEAAPVLRRLAAQADLLLCSEEEGRLMFGAEEPRAIVRAACAAGCGMVAVKRGGLGALVGTAGGAWEVPAWPIPAVVEPTGAGDAFAAGFLAGLLEARPPAEAGRMGAVCGALACRVAGDWEGAPERPLLDRLLGGRPQPLR